jgi:class 3 adenylate cyclase
VDKGMAEQADMESIFGKTVTAVIVKWDNEIDHQFDKEGHERCILFADLVGSTEYKQQHGERRGIGKSYVHNDLATQSVVRANGVIVKYTGDGLMAMFSGKDRCKNAISAGLDLIRRVIECNGNQSDPNNSRRFPHDLATRVGIHDGKVWLFKFDEATVPDPQGRTVDIAARLCSMASPMQVICTEQTFDGTGGAESFPFHSRPTRRLLRGVPDPVNVVAIATEDGARKSVPLPGSHDRAESEWAENQRKQAFDFFRQGKYADALSKVRSIISGNGSPRGEKDEGNFHANLQAAEIILFHVNSPEREREEYYNEADRYLCNAKMVREKCSRVWLLLGWLRILQYQHKHDVERIDRALEYLQRARKCADDDMNMDGVRYADIYKMYALWLRARHGTTTRENDLAEADRIGTELDKMFPPYVGHRKAEYLSAHALAKIERGDATNEGEARKIATMINESLKLDPTVSWSNDASGELMRIRKVDRRGLRHNSLSRVGDHGCGAPMINVIHINSGE